VPLSVQLGLLLALATAIASLLGFLLKHRGGVSIKALSGDDRFFGEPMSADPLGVTVRLAAFALVVTAAALTLPRARLTRR